MQIVSARPARRRGITLVAAFAATATALFGAAAVPAAAYDTSAHTAFRGDSLPMGQANSTVHAVAIAGGKIFAGGQFTSTRPAGAPKGTNETGQANLAAFDASSGAPLTSFAPELVNSWSGRPGVVRAMVLSPDKSTLYVGGDFNRVNGQKAEHVAKFDVATGEFLGEIGVNGVNGQVNALAISNDGTTLYVGGSFSKANWGVARNSVAAFNVSTGALTPWQPQISVQVQRALDIQAIAVSTDDKRVFIGGHFQRVNGVAQQGFAATYVSNSALVPGFDPNYNIAGSYGFTQALAVQNGRLYMGGHSDGAELQRNEGVNSLNDLTGQKYWYSACHGDTAAVLPVGDDVYVGSHTYECERSGMADTTPTTYYAMHALNTATGIMRPYWVSTGGTSLDNETLQMSRALATDGNQLIMGGGFNTTNGAGQANIARFALGSSAPMRAAWPNGYSCDGCNSIRVRTLVGADRDDMNLTYSIYRNATTTNPVYTVTKTTPWSDYRTTFDFNDTLPAGTQVYYRVKVTDPAGNETWSVRTPLYTVGRSGSTNSLTTTSTSRVAPSPTTSRVAPSKKKSKTRLPSMKPTTSAQKAADKAAQKADLK